MEKVNKAEVIEWAKQFLAQSENEITKEERKEQKKYAILVQRPNDKMLLSKMLDESSQIRNNAKLARRIKIIIERYGVPQFLNTTDTFMLRLFASFGYLFDFIAVPIFKKRLRSDTSRVIINEKPSLLNRHLNDRKKDHIGQNVNLLGEVVLGNGEAANRYYHYLEALKDPRINYISIKISGIYAQINPLNYAQNKIDLCERLARIYQQAIDYPYLEESGEPKSKFVNLDMEEYKDAELTMDVFMTVLSMPQFKKFQAGIVVQAYLPDAVHFQTELLEFAKKRFAEGGSPLKMRLVKGANLQMESIVSSLKGWENPIYETKVEVDANYLHILDEALKPENAKVMHIGVASHNFFSLGYAFLLSQKNGVEEFVTFEMLEGMANHLTRAMRALGKQIILYTPVVKDEHFLNAVSYLVRRLDENTGKDNFLSYSFNLRYDSKEWNFLKEQFEKAVSMKDAIDTTPRRTQNRKTYSTVISNLEEFKSESDTNFDLTPNRLWAEEIRKNWKKSPNDEPFQIPIQVGENEFTSEKKVSYIDHSQKEKVTVCEASLSNLEQVKSMIEIAENDASNWRKTSLEDRNKILHQVAENLSSSRGDLIGCMSAITGKTFGEGDVEVSEAIDFCRYYPISMKRFEQLNTVSMTPKGVVLVIPPWNFPLAIPVGGVAAALTGGNTVILKPATVALPVAWAFAKCFWDAGVPKDALQVVCTDGREPLNYLTAHSAIKHIILTGGTDTAFRLLENNPTCPLSAETGGKNAIILTASGDRDHAIQNIVTSAFSNAGQKCSACSLLLLEKEVFNDPDFKTKLTDAVKSMQVGGAWNGGTVVGPMITAENDKLLHAINHLEEGESWLVAPEFVDEQHFILKPCVKWGVKPTSYTFQTELFAPLLSVVCIDDLKQGIEFVNRSEYGLTSGLQSLDEAEQELWKNSIEAGNLYINRGITGAIVSRQPFGGMKRSAFGGGIKAGGPNYVSCFVNIEENQKMISEKSSNKEFELFNSLLDEKEQIRFQTAVASYQKAYEEEFSQERDIHHLMGEQNIFRYLPLRNIVLRVNENDSVCDILMILAASTIAKTPISLSLSKEDQKLSALRKCSKSDCSIYVQTEKAFLVEMENFDRIRTCTSKLSDKMYHEAARLGKYIATAKPLTEGRLELLHYLKEQSVTFEYHRYGSITEKLE
ncbi:MAG: bifunctional proline dehydrogenase/L-glutamate gamma-semialdehyde dehydrogenase [Bacteroidales bacterium]|nr:bifunctional proline dehydrogenase/L-glutamate gamma-semialdehyde dehydrogenase [Bacteroidales bacterium]